MNKHCDYEYPGVELGGSTDRRTSDVVFAIIMFLSFGTAVLLWEFANVSPFDSAFAGALCLALGVLYVSNLFKSRTESKRISFDRDGVVIWFFRSERIGSKWEAYTIKVDWADVNRLNALCGGETPDCAQLELNEPCAAGQSFTLPTRGSESAQDFVSSALALRPS